jgi:hypothetical protein
MSSKPSGVRLRVVKSTPSSSGAECGCGCGVGCGCCGSCENDAGAHPHEDGPRERRQRRGCGDARSSHDSGAVVRCPNRVIQDCCGHCCIGGTQEGCRRSTEKCDPFFGGSTGARQGSRIDASRRRPPPPRRSATTKAVQRPACISAKATTTSRPLLHPPEQRLPPRHRFPLRLCHRPRQGIGFPSPHRPSLLPLPPRHRSPPPPRHRPPPLSLHLPLPPPRHRPPQLPPPRH